MEITEEKRKEFLEELATVCKKYGLSLAHEDSQGAFLVELYDESNIQWLLAAYIST